MTTHSYFLTTTFSRLNQGECFLLYPDGFPLVKLESRDSGPNAVLINTGTLRSIDGNWEVIPVALDKTKKLSLPPKIDLDMDWKNGLASRLKAANPSIPEKIKKKQAKE